MNMNFASVKSSRDDNKERKILFFLLGGWAQKLKHVIGGVRKQ